MITAEWHEATARELRDLPPDTLVRIGNGGAHRAREYDSLRLPGGYAFLMGISYLLPVYILS